MTSRLRAFAELLRISLAPTVVADLCGGVALAQPVLGGMESVARLAGTSLLLFVGGMALNAWVDREEDAATRPRRPLPSGAIAPGVALALAVVGLAGAPALAAAIGGPHARDAALAAAAIAGAIALYHTPLKRSAIAGPLLLGSIRAGDLLLGAIGVLGLRGGVAAAWPVAAAYGAYVAGASGVAHEEDRFPRMTLVRGAVVVALTAVGVNGALGWLAAERRGDAAQQSAGALLLAAFHLWKSSPVLVLFRAGAPGLVPLSVHARVLLSALPLIPAVAAIGAGSLDLGLAAAGAWFLVMALVRVVPPT
jgi:4-hydroxybenzoate polyprenyltransferase